jgi:hypothetical protein
VAQIISTNGRKTAGRPFPVAPLFFLLSTLPCAIFSDNSFFTLYLLWEPHLAAIIGAETLSHNSLPTDGA